MKNFNKTVLITGSSGFIGFHLSKLLLDEGWKVIGIDSLTNYYDVNLKKNRQSVLDQQSNFFCYNECINEKDILEKICKKHQPDVIVHLAAQAGVRFSIDNPRSYVDANLLGTFNVLEVSRMLKLKHLLVASTSSVYGANNVMPFDELQKCDTPLSFYAATKKANEVMCHSYSYNFLLPITMFRFFTAYGPWGRPDMALYKFTKAILNNKQIDVYNYGKMERDFTYIDDISQSIRKLINVIPKKPHSTNKIFPGDSLSTVAPWRVVNIGNANPINLLKFIELIEKSLGIKAKINYLGMQPGDVEKTWSNINLLKKLTGFQPKISIEEGIKSFVDWYLNYERK